MAARVGHAHLTSRAVEGRAAMGCPRDALITLARRFTSGQTCQPIRSASSMMIPLGAAEAEPVAVLVLLQLADEFGAASPQPVEDIVDSLQRT
jgi:hypothetical protein